MAHLLAFFTDIRIICGGIGAVVSAVGVLQVFIYRKQIATDKGVKRNETALDAANKSIHSLHRVVDDDIRHEIGVLKKQNADIARTTAHLETLIERRSTQTEHHPGRRAADRRAPEQPRREPIRVVEPLHDPKAGTWPIGGDFAS